MKPILEIVLSENRDTATPIYIIEDSSIKSYYD